MILPDAVNLKDIDVKRKCLSSGTYGTGMLVGLDRDRATSSDAQGSGLDPTIRHHPGTNTASFHDLG